MNSLETPTAPVAEAVVAQAPIEAKKADSSFSVGALALAGVGALAVGALNSSPARAVSPALTFSDIPGTGDFKVLNYALALEDLETELYVQAIQRMTTGGRGGRDAPPGLNIPGLGLSTNNRVVSLTTTFGRVERQHRDFLRNAIGNAAIRPFNYSFGIESMTLNQLLNLLYTIEQGGTNAYLGAVPLFATKNYIPAAAAIQGTEARHTAIFADILNDVTGANILPSPPPNAIGPVPVGTNLSGSRERPVEPNVILATVSPFIVIPASAR